MSFVKFLKSKIWKAISITVNAFAILFAFLFTVATLAGSIMLENSDSINAFFNVQTSITVNEEPTDEDGTKKEVDSMYYKSSAKTIKETREKGEEIIQKVMEEGAVLLKNEHDALPLKANAKVSLYSASSVDPIITGTGSSGTSNNLSKDNYYDKDGGVEVVNFDAAFKDAGLQLNTTLWDWYKSTYGTYGRQKSGDWGAYFSIRDAAWSNIPDNCKNFGGTAVFVVSRRSGEGNDMGSYYGNDMVKAKWNRTNDMTNGNYLALSPTELSVLEGLNKEKAAGKLDSIVVLINSANPVQCDFADDDRLGVDAVMWCGTLGQTGSRGVANLLAGKVNPSGKLSDTFWKYHYKNPVNANFGKDMYHDGEWTEQVPMTWLKQEQANSSDAAMKTNMINNSRSTVYAEGIYVGYRYTETRYEDYVNGAGNAGDFDYYDTVSYPFGYGLSYTTFEYSNFKVSRTQQSGKMEDSVYNISVDVKNTGSESGREAVQIYLQKPYTSYDKYSQIEKASVELVEFGKTDELEPDASETVTFTVNERELACYDAKGAGTYILEAGDYYFTAAKDAHEAVNNILKAKNANASTEAQGVTGLGDAKLASLQKVNKDDFETYSTSTKAMEKGAKNTPTQITNRFEEADILYYEGATENFSYVTRSDWEGTVTYGFDANGNKTDKQVKVTVTDEMYQDRKAAMTDPEPILGDEYPNYGINNNIDAEGHLKLIDLRAYADDDDDVSNDVRIAYNDPLWDTLLDQLTWEETCDLLKSGWRLTGAIESIAKPETVDFNGSVGFVRRYISTDGKHPGLAASDTTTPNKDKMMICFYPCNGICASTFDKQLMEDYGVQWGEDSLWSGCSGLYGMGVNLHRSPYGGRNFEYYSEDPYLMGKIASCTAKGCASKGLYVYLKHCVINEQESYRIGGYCWMNEQTMREIYLKPFQIPIEDGYADCVMTAEPALGVKWSGQQGFVQTVLRDEFGMTGIAVSDYTRDIDGNYLQAFLAGSDLPDGTVNDMFDGITTTVNGVKTYKEGYGELARAMRESTHRILYTVVHSNAMNGVTSYTRVYKLTPGWITTLNGVKTAFTALFVLFAVLCVGTLLTETAGKILATVLKAEDVPSAQPQEITPADGGDEPSEQ